jgi:biopolymer transport protein ExbB
MWELLKSGGPIMWPLLACSIVAVAYTVERAIALRARRLGTERFARDVVTVARAEGHARAQAVCAAETGAQARILAQALALEGLPAEERERRAGDLATHEVKRLAWNLKPLMLVYLVAPLLGLLGTVWGLILCFATIATQQGLGRPEMLATGVYQALVTTAAGLSVAIPTLVVYTHFKNRIERFARRTEELWLELSGALGQGAVARSGSDAAPLLEAPRAHP